MRRISFSILALTFCVSSVVAADVSNTWPQWRGPTRDGQFVGPKWPDSLDGLKQSWRAEIGPGYSGPIVSENRVFTVETEAGEKEVVRAFDRASGKQLWRSDWAGSMKVPFYARGNGSWTRSTPAFYGDRLYVGGMQDVLVCLDAKSGAEVWRADLAERHQRPIPQFGFVCSPLLVGDALYVLAADAVLKIDKHTGKTVWRVFQEAKPGKSLSAFSSPIVANLHGREQLVAQTRKSLAGFDLADGKTLWSAPIKSSHDQNVLTPVVYENGVFMSSYGGRSQYLSVTKAGEAWAVEKLWDNKLQGYMSSPVIVGGHAYLHLRNNRLACADLKSGEIGWTTSEKFTNYASLVTNRDRILALDSEGTLHLIAADPKEFRRLAEREIADAETWAHLAVVGNEVFIREQQAITAFVWRP
ncbi:MAG: PQQ-binding-like beta-propeller repeat protein [Verrucomicrobiia bacterium]|jgi:outer membrane protein assembly factor BamB